MKNALIIIYNNLFYLYKKLSKKLCELRQLYDMLKEVYDFKDGQLKPVKTQGACWIEHFSVFICNILRTLLRTLQRNVIAHRQLINAEVLLKCYVFVDLLQSAKNFSLASQYKDTDVIMLVERIYDMKLTYQRFGKKFAKSPESVFQLPMIKKVLEHITQDGDGDYVYQGIRLNYFERAKDAIANNVLEDVNAILDLHTQTIRYFYCYWRSRSGRRGWRTSCCRRQGSTCVALTITEIGSCQIIVFPMSKILLMWS